MRTSPLYLFVLLPLLLVVIATNIGKANAGNIYFNTTAPCAVLQNTCNFFDNDTWSGGLYPGPLDYVYINGENRVNTSYVAIILDSTSPQGNSVNVYRISAYNVNFYFKNVSAYIYAFSLYYMNVSITNSQVNVSSLAVDFLFVNSSSLTIGTTTTLSVVNVFDSVISSLNTLSVQNLTVYGNTVLNCDLRIVTSATFITVPNLQLDYVTVLYGSNLTFIDSPSNISVISVGSYGSINYFASSSATADHTLGTLSYTSTSYASASLLLGNNVSLVLAQGGSSAFRLSMGDFSSLTTAIPGYFSWVSFLPANISSLATINAYSQLSLYGGYVPARVLVTERATLTIYSATKFGVSNGACSVSGPGSLVVSSPFTCPGSLNIGSVTISSTLNVSSLSTEFITGNSYGHIHGDVETEGLALQYVLTIDGDFAQSSGNVSVYLGTSYKDSPILSVEGKFEMSAQYVTVLSRSYLDETDAEFMFAQFEKSHKIHLGHITDRENPTRKLSYRVAEETLFIGRHRSYIARNYQWMIIAAVLALILVLIVWCLSCAKNSKTFEDMEKNDPHLTIKDYFNNLQWKKVTCGTIVGLVIIGIFFLPLFLEAFFFTIALALLIPLGFFIGLFEHRFVFLWAVIVLFIQVGGFLDLFADISLVAKFFVFFFDHSFGIDNPNDKEIAEDLEVISLVRLGITLGGSITSLFFIWMMTSVFGKFLYELTGKMFLYDPKGNISIRGGGTVLGLIALLCIMLWKVVLMAFRAHLLFAVARSLFTHGRLTEQVQRKVQWIELILFLDLMWSGFPLGVLTALELFVYDKELDVSGEVVFELLKMGALAVDLVGACFLIYYVIFGLNHKCPGLHHDHHDSHHDHDHDNHHDPHGHKDASQATVSVNATDTTPLLINGAAPRT